METQTKLRRRTQQGVHVLVLEKGHGLPTCDLGKIHLKILDSSVLFGLMIAKSVFTLKKIIH
jgi:hypothetical protein